MPGNISRGRPPFQFSIFGEAEYFAIRNIIFRICDKNITVIRVYSDTVRNNDFLFVAILNKLIAEGLIRIGINNAVAAYRSGRSPLVTVIVHSVFYESHVANGLVDFLNHGIGIGIEDVRFWRNIHIISSGSYP